MINTPFLSLSRALLVFVITAGSASAGWMNLSGTNTPAFPPPASDSCPLGYGFANPTSQGYSATGQGQALDQFSVGCAVFVQQNAVATYNRLWIYVPLEGEPASGKVDARIRVEAEGEVELYYGNCAGAVAGFVNWDVNVLPGIEARLDECAAETSSSLLGNFTIKTPVGSFGLIMGAGYGVFPDSDVCEAHDVVCSNKYRARAKGESFLVFYADEDLVEIGAVEGGMAINTVVYDVKLSACAHSGDQAHY